MKNFLSPTFIIFSILVSVIFILSTAQAEAPSSNKAVVVGLSYLHDRNEKAGRHDEIPDKNNIQDATQTVNNALDNTTILYRTVKSLNKAEQERFFRIYPEKKAIYEKEVARRENTTSEDQQRTTKSSKQNINSTNHHSFYRKINNRPGHNNEANLNKITRNNHSIDDEAAALVGNVNELCDQINGACKDINEQLPPLDQINKKLNQFNKWLEGKNKKMQEKIKQKEQKDHALPVAPGEDNSERDANPKVKMQDELDITSATLDEDGTNQSATHVDNSERHDFSHIVPAAETTPPAKGGPGISK